MTQSNLQQKRELSPPTKEVTVKESITKSPCINYDQKVLTYVAQLRVCITAASYHESHLSVRLKIFNMDEAHYQHSWGYLKWLSSEFSLSKRDGFPWLFYDFSRPGWNSTLSLRPFTGFVGVGIPENFQNSLTFPWSWEFCGIFPDFLGKFPDLQSSIQISWLFQVFWFSRSLDTLWVISSVLLSTCSMAESYHQYCWGCAVWPSHIISMAEDIQHGWVTSSILLWMYSMAESYHQDSWGYDRWSTGEENHKLLERGGGHFWNIFMDGLILVFLLNQLKTISSYWWTVETNSLKKG